MLAMIFSSPPQQDLLEAIEERHGVGATIVTSQLSVADWHEYLGGGRIADAILDRIIHNAHRIEVASKNSMRKDSMPKNGTDLLHAGQSDIQSPGLHRFAPKLSVMPGSTVRLGRNAHLKVLTCMLPKL